MRKVLTVFSVLALATATQADVIVSWGPTADSITVNQAITVTTTFDDTSGFQSPTVGANYNNTSAVADPNFYASLDGAPGASFRIHNGGAADLLGRFQDNNAGLAGPSSMLLAWEVTSSLTVTGFTVNGASEFGGSTARSISFVVEDSVGGWHVSDAQAVAGNVDIISAASALTWSAFTPHVGGVASTGAASTPNLTDVNKAGYFYEWTTDGTGGVYALGFQVDGTVIPEPATGLLLAFGTLATLLVRRFRG